MRSSLRYLSFLVYHGHIFFSLCAHDLLLSWIRTVWILIGLSYISQRRAAICIRCSGDFNNGLIMCSYTNHIRWANYISPMQLQIPYSVCARNYESWLTVDKVIAIINNSLCSWGFLYRGHFWTPDRFPLRAVFGMWVKVEITLSSNNRQRHPYADLLES